MELYYRTADLPANLYLCGHSREAQINRGSRYLLRMKPSILWISCARLSTYYIRSVRISYERVRTCSYTEI